MFKNAHAVLSGAVTMARQLRRTSWIIEVAVPAILDADWASATVQGGVRQELVREILAWRNLPDLGLHAEDLLRAVDPNFVRRSTGSAPTEWEAVVESGNAFALARYIKQPGVCEPGEADLPVVSGCTPKGFLSACKRRGVAGVGLDRALRASSLQHVVRSKKASLEPMAAALNAWGSFCDLLHVSHFPVCPERAVQFAAICREGSTYKMYVVHLKLACEFMGKLGL